MVKKLWEEVPTVPGPRVDGAAVQAVIRAAWPKRPYSYDRWRDLTVTKGWLVGEVARSLNLDGGAAWREVETHLPRCGIAGWERG